MSKLRTRGDALRGWAPPRTMTLFVATRGTRCCVPVRPSPGHPSLWHGSTCAATVITAALGTKEVDPRWTRAVGVGRLRRSKGRRAVRASAWMPPSADVLLLVPQPLAQLQPTVFGLADQSGRKSIDHDGERLVLQAATAALRYALPITGASQEGDRFGYLICIDRLPNAAGASQAKPCAAVVRSRSRLLLRSSIGRIEHGSRTCARCRRSTGGLPAHRSVRLPRQSSENAVVAAGWHGDGSLRAQVRHLIRRGRYFMIAATNGLSTSPFRPEPSPQKGTEMKPSHAESPFPPPASASKLSPAASALLVDLHHRSRGAAMSQTRHVTLLQRAT